MELGSDWPNDVCVARFGLASLNSKHSRELATLAKIGMCSYGVSYNEQQGLPDTRNTCWVTSQPTEPALPL